MERIKVYKNIGEIKGNILVFGGVYSNLQALKEMYRISKTLQISPANIICTGDVVGYCAQAEECVQFVKKWGIHCIAGNVEIQLRENKDECGCDFTSGSKCDVLSKQWYPYAQSQLSSSSVNWMKTLPDFIEFKYGDKNCFVLHGSVRKTAEFIFKSTSWNTKKGIFSQAKSDLIIAGHCGLPFNEIQNKLTWLNPGVIGMPANDATTRVWYATLQFNNKIVEFEHHNFNYDYCTTIKLMEKNHLSSEYATTLKTGFWDNCDVLPKQETLAQGFEINF